MLLAFLIISSFSLLSPSLDKLFKLLDILFVTLLIFFLISLDLLEKNSLNLLPSSLVFLEKS